MSSPNPNVSKLSPGVGSKSSKTLLTPCRQIGLSRKKKTPTSANSQRISEILSQDLTPVGRDVKKRENSTPKSAMEHPKKRRVSKKLLEESEPLNEPPESVEITDNKSFVECSVIKGSPKEAACEPNNSRSPGQENNALKSSKKSPEKKKIEGKPDDQENIALKSSRISPERQEKSTNKENKPLEKKPKKTFKRSLSMKKSSEDDILEEPPVVVNSPAELVIELEQISPAKSEKDLEPENIPLIFKPPDHSDEDDFTTPTKTTKQLQKEIKEKKDKLEKLRQALIYKQKHDIKELNSLTDSWVRGCALALVDLVNILKEQDGQTTMESLIKELKIPEEMVLKLGPFIK